MKRIALIIITTVSMHQIRADMCYGYDCQPGIQVPPTTFPIQQEPQPVQPIANPMYPSQGQSCNFSTDCAPAERCMKRRGELVGICY